MKDNVGKKPFLVVLLICLLLCSCAVKRRGGITGYHQGKVQAGSGNFEVAVLPDPWTGPRRELNQLVYGNEDLAATVIVDALCGRKFDDAPLPILARNLFAGLDNSETGQSESIELQNREALQLDGKGSMDGVPLEMRVVVMKKNFCLYDFIYFAPPGSFASGLPDFMRYVYDLRIP